MSSVTPDPAEPHDAASQPPSPPPPTGPGLRPPRASELPIARQEGMTGANAASNGAPGDSAQGPRLDIEEPVWSAWQGVLSFAAALLGTVIIGAAVVGTVAAATGASLDSQPPPALNILGVVVQDLVFVTAALAFAAITARPRAWHFGLRRTRLWSTVGWAMLGTFVYFLFNIGYEALVEPRAQQSVADALGVNDSAALLVVGGFVIIVMAPIAEEFFFRAFFYRAVRNSLARRFGRWGGAVLGAVITGLLFGAVHFEPDAVAIIPVLAVLGAMFCLVYERTGSLFSVIGLHALINATAFLAVAKHSWPVALGFGGGMILACLVLPKSLSRGPAPAAA